MAKQVRLRSAFFDFGGNFACEKKFGVYYTFTKTQHMADEQFKDYIEKEMNIFTQGLPKDKRDQAIISLVKGMGFSSPLGWSDARIYHEKDAPAVFVHFLALSPQQIPGVFVNNSPLTEAEIQHPRTLQLKCPEPFMFGEYDVEKRQGIYYEFNSPGLASPIIVPLNAVGSLEIMGDVQELPGGIPIGYDMSQYGGGLQFTIGAMPFADALKYAAVIPSWGPANAAAITASRLRAKDALLESNPQATEAEIAAAEEAAGKAFSEERKRRGLEAIERAGGPQGVATKALTLADEMAAAAAAAPAAAGGAAQRRFRKKRSSRKQRHSRKHTRKQKR